jgi:hypothetical protein
LSGTEHTNQNDFDFNKLNSKRIYHINHIKKLSIRYRLRFLSTKFFKGEYPEEAVSKIRALEAEHNTKLRGFKVMAPAKLFKLKDVDDPLLFAPLGNDYYYLIHKWGKDISFWRKIKFWSFMNIDNFLKASFYLSVLLTIVTVPFFSNSNWSFIEITLLFMFYFKAIVGFSLLLYGVSGKSFSEFVWDSQYNKLR